MPSEKDADEAVRKLRAGLSESSEGAQIQAVRAALLTRHERVIRTAAVALTAGSERLRIATALALGECDHPVSVELLAAALAPNAEYPPVTAAIASALGTLEWEFAAPALHELLRKMGDEDIRRAGPEIFAAIGRIGSASSVDPLLDFLHRVQTPKQKAWEDAPLLIKAAREALRRITGGKPEILSYFEDWWEENRAHLTANARRIWWLRETHERVDLGPGEKPPAGAFFVHAKLVEKAPEPKKKKP